MTTNLPAPSAHTVGRRGVYSHVDPLRTELRDLIADLGPEWIDDRDADAVHRWERTHVPLVVGIYVPNGYRASIHLGWYPSGITWHEARDRVLAHLPGARAVDEAPRLHGDVSCAVQWGSRTPGWSPTAVRVRRSRIGAGVWRERDEVWTSSEVAAHLDVAESTWRSYLARGDAGAPKPLGEARIDGRRRDVWDPEVVTAWHAARPGKGGRPRTDAYS